MEGQESTKIQDFPGFIGAINEWKSDHSEKIIFTGKIEYIINTLKDYDTQFFFKFQGKKFDELSNLLTDLYKQVIKLNRDFLMSNLFDSEAIDRVISEINKTMIEIYYFLIKHGITGLKKVKNEMYSRDLLQIQYFLDDIINKAQEKKKESKIKMNKCVENHLDLTNESTSYICSKYKKYDNIVIDKFNGEPEIKEDNDYFEYFEQEYYGKPVILIRSKSGDKYQGRLLSVYDKLCNNKSEISKYIEKFDGFFTDDVSAETNSKQIVIVIEREGEDIFDKAKSNSFSVQEKTFLSFKIALTMFYVHSRNVIHRNLTAKNINYYITDSEINPMIINFVSSRIIPKDEEKDKTEYSNISHVNPEAFVAPEYLNGNTKYGKSVDVFAFGTILYLLATGEVPFGDKKSSEIEQLLLKGERPSLEIIKNEKLAELINNCWEQEPNDRITFCQIIEDMSMNKIICDANVDEDEEVNNYYEKYCNCSNLKNQCTDEIKLIQENIKKVYQYRNEFLSTNEYINKFLYYLCEEYKPENPNDTEEQAKIQKLLTNLSEYQTVVNNASIESWKNFKVSQIPDDIKNSMRKIEESMKNLGYSSNEVYCQNKQDLICDFRELNFTLLVNKEQATKESINKKRKQIRDYLNDTDDFKEVINPSKLLTKQRINEFLYKFAQYENDDEDFGKLAQINSNDYLINQNDGDNFVDNNQNQGVLYKSDKSIVYEGKDDKGVPVAIKSFNYPYISQSEQNLIKLRNEIEYISKVDHKYIIKLRCYQILNPDPDNLEVRLITNLGAKGTLNQVLKNPEITGKQKTSFARKIADALKYLESKNISHHNLDSSNIVIDKDDNPLIIDFGQAAHGKNNATLDKSDDLYAFSMILTEMLTGQTNPQEIPTDTEGIDQKLIEIIKNGYQTNRKTFEEICNIMDNYHVSFP